jgi:S1-C subfamily serine protease
MSSKTTNKNRVDACRAETARPTVTAFIRLGGAVLLVLALLGGCWTFDAASSPSSTSSSKSSSPGSTRGLATDYKPEGFKGGYADTEVNPGVFPITFRGNGFTSQQEVHDLVRLRAAEVAIEEGLPYFVILQRDQTVTYAPVGNTQVPKYKAFIWIQVFASKPSTDLVVYDAEFVYENINQDYDLGLPSLSVAVKEPSDGQPGTGTPPQGGSSPTGSGTGFFVTAAGHVVTNHHVVDGAGRVEVAYDDVSLLAETIAVDEDVDLALLKVDHPDGEQFAHLGVSLSQASLGTEVFTVGFPAPDLQGVSPKLTTGVISSTAGLKDDQRVYQTSVPIQPGNSGGPLVTEDGQVVGIIVASLNSVAAFNRTGSLPQNVNYAIKSSRLVPLLSDAGILGRVQTDSGTNLSRQQANALVVESVTMVLTY